MAAKDERVSKQSMDLVEFNKERLLEMFPIFRTEGGGVDFDRLKLALGESVDVGKEVFGMRWPGKAESMRLANLPSHGTLSPDKKESVSFDTTKNLIIEGDNLEVLKLLQKSYQGKVKMIYIDPPYNTGNDFVYKDDFADGIKNYLQQSGQVDDEGNLLSTNSETEGRFHSNWLNLMYPRLYVAQNLLREDGVIFISIDDNELKNLLSVSDSVFGEKNLVAIFTWIKKRKASNLDLQVRSITEYVVCYKKKEVVELVASEDIPEENKPYPFYNSGNKRAVLMFPAGKISTQMSDGLYPKGEYVDNRTVVNLLDDVKVSAGFVVNDFRLEGEWRYSQKSLDEKIQSNERIELKGSKFKPYWINNSERKKYVRTLLDDETYGVGTNEAGNQEVAELLGNGIFPFPKPVALVSKLIELCTVGDDVVLDFFAGSGTTAHAVMAQNAKDGGNRQFALVQLPEPVDPESEAAKAGFKNIADITKERVRRAGKKIIEESEGKLKLKGEDAVDFGFRVLKLNESNIEEWDSEEASKSPKDLLDALKTTRLKSGRSDQDVVFEVLVKYGVELTSSVEEEKVGKGSVWKIGGDELFVIVKPGLTAADLHAIVKMSPKVVVMLDESFVPEALKTNARAIFKDAKIELKTF